MKVRVFETKNKRRVIRNEDKIVPIRIEINDTELIMGGELKKWGFWGVFTKSGI